jgi:hypothetical protein
VVTSLLLVPTFISGLFGANTTVPGQGHWSGLVLMVSVMVLGAGTTFALIRRIRSGPSAPSGRAIYRDDQSVTPSRFGGGGTR